ncbi:hypothetical protein Cni_G24553 [Canna indica]|uniref:Uncharacterized protein n=1 Tax=Canna indica TaxID=4628 RepID=A0AAQ3KYA1_9LILI|nr:hypothetical protein Cni_G24553 [Canna indica]
MTPFDDALAFANCTEKTLHHLFFKSEFKNMVLKVLLIAGLVISAALMVCVTREANASLQKALTENLEVDGTLVTPPLPAMSEPLPDLNQPLIIKIDDDGTNN